MAFNYYTHFPQNWQHCQLSISLGWQQFNMSIMYPKKHHHHSFSSWSATLQLHLIYRTQKCNRTCFRRLTSRKSWRYNFCCKALQRTEFTRLRSKLLGSKFFFASMNSIAQNTSGMCTVNCRFNHSILSLHLCKEYLTAVKWQTLFLLQIKYWTIWCMDCSSSSSSFLSSVSLCWRWGFDKPSPSASISGQNRCCCEIFVT